MAARTVEIGSGPVWSWVAVVGLGLAVLFFVVIGGICIGYRLFRAEQDMGQVWIAGVVAWLIVPLLGSMIVGRFVSVARIEIGGSGAWTLRSPAGRVVATIPPETPRSLSLWQRFSRGASKASRPTGAIYGFVDVGGRRHPLEDGSRCWDLLQDLGYGKVLIRDNDLPDARIAQAQADGRLLLRLGNEEHALRLPDHRYDEAGRDEVARWLVSR